jgi:hypothetical protein
MLMRKVFSQGCDMKTCTKCLVEKPFEDFPKDKYKKSGLKSSCKVCETKKSRLFRKNNPEKSRDTSKKYRQANLEKERLRYTLYNKLNPQVRAKNAAKRRFFKQNATPSWLTEQHFAEIENFYELARDCEITSGQKYHVDHIVPLKGVHVCGLHVPWNLQVLPADVNQSKGNNYEEAK